MEQERNEIVIILATLIVVIITLSLVWLFIIFQKRKNNLLQDQVDAKKQFEKEIAETQIEIKEQTLRNISWELHDNIGQLLTLAKIQLQSATEENIAEVRDTISKGLEEVRALSKLINPDVVKNIKLCEAVQLEIDRFNRLNFIKSNLTIQGDTKKLDPKSEIILFRILQEFFSNTIKHSKATELEVNLNYFDTQLEIIAKDNGVGYDTSIDTNNGIGLNNIQNRAKLINTEIEMTSELEKGTTLKIIHIFE
ncbi:MAG: two-component system NarL family sensor kinase [Urechidicola sp.]|jgi:two-component system NarL family sensor kinase|tara:strand:- start:1196 stop:1951 length:756 start_codon:yes stop_codon:yes gene_type:complete